MSTASGSAMSQKTHYHAARSLRSVFEELPVFVRGFMVVARAVGSG